MIFLTVGTQLGFDRLVEVVDVWASDKSDLDIFAQIGEGVYLPRNFPWCRHLHPLEFREKFDAADLIIGHAGMGTIIESLVSAKPCIVMPRKFELKEQRNNHQLATCRQFSKIDGFCVAWDEHDLIQYLDFPKEWAQRKFPAFACEDLLSTIDEFICS